MTDSAACPTPAAMPLEHEHESKGVTETGSCAIVVKPVSKGEPAHHAAKPLLYLLPLCAPLFHCKTKATATQSSPRKQVQVAHTTVDVSQRASPLCSNTESTAVTAPEQKQSCLGFAYTQLHPAHVLASKSKHFRCTGKGHSTVSILGNVWNASQSLGMTLMD